MLYTTMYKRNTNKSIQVWELHRDENSYWSVSGKLEGKMTTNKHTACPPKQKRTQEDQVISVCDSQVEKKRRKKYVPNIEDVDTANDNLPGFEPMLAHLYIDHKAKITYPCIVQPKLDGIRNLADASGFTSRGRKVFDSCRHIKEELDSFFAEQPHARIDGELYTHEFREDFEKICAAVKKSHDRATPEELELQRKIKYWVYDAPRIGSLCEDDAFSDRQACIAETFRDFKYVVVVPTVIIQNEAELMKYKEQWIQEGFEGIMVRQMHAGYESQRSFTLQKFKDFVDAEWVIVQINEGEGKLHGHAGSFSFPIDRADTAGMLDGSIPIILKKGANGNAFSGKLIGSIGRLKTIFENPDMAIGKEATIRYQNLTCYDVPRFPVCRCIRDYE